MTSVRGSVTYRERIALPSGATVRVWLEDVSPRHVPALVLAETRVVTAGEQVPIPFELDLAGVTLDPRETYALRASIDSGGVTRFATPAQQPLPAGEDEIELVVSAPPPDDRLTGTHWELAEVAGEAVEPGSGAHIVLDAETSRVSGSGGCNRLTGSYETDGDELRFGPVATTLMAGPEPVMRREAAFLAALSATTRHVLGPASLVLFDGDRVVARLVAAPR
jgi:putative lipoprotein